MDTNFVDEKNRKISVQFSKSDTVVFSGGEYVVPQDFIGSTLYAGADGDVNIMLLDDSGSRIVAVKKGHTLYRLKKVIESGTTATGLAMFA